MTTTATTDEKDEKTSSRTRKKQPSYLAINYRPKLHNPPLRGEHIFMYPLREGARPGGSVPEIELTQVVLKRGINFIDSQKWLTAEKFPPNVNAIKNLTRRNVITIHEPDAENESKDTTDFNDIDVVTEILQDMSDRDWLERSRSRDSRAEVEQMISKRLEQLRDDEEQQAKQNVAGQSY